MIKSKKMEKKKCKKGKSAPALPHRLSELFGIWRIGTTSSASYTTNLDTGEGKVHILKLHAGTSSRTNIGMLKILSRLVTSIKEEGQIRWMKNFI